MQKQQTGQERKAVNSLETASQISLNVSRARCDSGRDNKLKRTLKLLTVAEERSNHRSADFAYF